MYVYRPYRCQVCHTEKELLTEDDGPTLSFCESCSVTPERQADKAQMVEAFGVTRTMRLFECIESWIEMDVELHDDVIKHSPLFEDMLTWQVKRVVMLGETRKLDQGDTIVSQGETDQFTYVLLTGSANVTISGEDGAQVDMATIGIGEVFGEVASILGIARTANVVAAEPAEVFALDAAAVERIGKYYPRIAYRVTRNSAKVLGRRFQGVNAELAEWKQVWNKASEASSH